MEYLTMGSSNQDNTALKDRLIRNVKKEVKQIMEEAVTRKFVHEESSSITSLCGAVEACLSQGLRRRALGLFKTSSTTALLHKLAKTFKPAALVSRRVLELEARDPRRSSSSGDSTNRLPKVPLQKKNSSGGPPPGPRYLWIRLALFEKVLARIIDHLVENSSKYYEKDALVADPDYGSILSSLLVGPCALDYSKTKTQDHFWTDPPADELVQRHRISSGIATPPSCRRPALNYRRSLHAVSSEESHRALPPSAKDYVESLHQNSRATLLYGKNNVLVLPKELAEPIPGYLSLHQSAHSLTIKWTPNQLMNGYSESSTTTDKSLYWDYAMHVRVEEVVYVHCHQQADSGGTVVLVGQDGVQQPPIHFPRGGHLLQFLSCLETGLLPHGQLDPPLWAQRGKGKVFPKLRRKGRIPRSQEDSDEGATDYVFRIVSKTHHEDYLAGQELMEPWPSTRARTQLASTSTASSTSSSKSLSLGEAPDSPRPGTTTAPPVAEDCASIQLVCVTMRRQIISRAFYGWLAYCRHLSTVRTHLSGLVHPPAAAPTPEESSVGVGAAEWAALLGSDGCIADSEHLFRCTYYGGIEHSIRKEVWPYLLGHYPFGSTPGERAELDESMRRRYETTVSEWLAVEAIVRQRDREAMAANLAKLSSESTSGDGAPPALNKDLSNEVFEDSAGSEDEEEDDDDVVLEENEGDVTAAKVTSDVNGNGDEESMTNGNERIPDKENALPNGSDSIAKSNDALVNNNERIPEEEEEQEVLVNENERISKEADAAVKREQNGTDNKLVSCDSTQVKDGTAMMVNGDQQVIKNGDAVMVNGHCKKMEGVDENGEVDEGVEEDRPPDESDVDAQSTVIVTNPSLDSGHQSDPYTEDSGDRVLTPPDEEGEALDMLVVAEETGAGDGASQGSRSTCVSPASSQGGVYSMELLETFGLNLHRVDKDVQRCDRHLGYFTTANLDKLRNVMCSYVWQHLEVGYLQGMCDLAAPLLVVFDDEALTYACFCRLMERMAANFPHGGAMDTHFANMRSLIQILDSEVFELMHQNGDYTHFYFCYRWFLLDFKRELVYEDVFSTWETIWAARNVSSNHFVLFIALALVESYRDIILTNSMDFTDIIKFFNEMAERHDAKAILALARDLVQQLQTLIENK